MDQLDDVGACRVSEVMGTELYTLTPDTAVASARRLALANGVEHLLVLEKGTLTGIVCGADLRAASRDSLVGECMSSPVLCIGPETTLQEAIEIMAENDVGCLPVVTGHYLVGIVSRDALATAGLTDEPAREPEVCVACHASKRVRREPRAGGAPLCEACLGRTGNPFAAD
ncbi:MAG TPA: CBS domain-containing protein [Polyangia bacterium]|nr:CBS domain-containing protein [Polyangia bacterium]